MPKKLIVFLALIILIVGGRVIEKPTNVQAASPETLWFSGYQWTVRSGWGGPGPNRWSESNVWKDANGYLHLKLSKQNGLWYSAQLSTVKRFGFGKYQFQVIGAIDKFDPNVVLGLFSYPTADVGKDGTNEIDIEFSRWGDPAHPAGSYTVWPVLEGLALKHHPFAFSLSGLNTTQRYTWSSTQVYFQSLRGFRNNDIGQYASWTYSPNDYLDRISQQAMPVYINLWLMAGHVPTDGRQVEIIIRNFKYTP